MKHIRECDGMDVHSITADDIPTLFKRVAKFANSGADIESVVVTYLGDDLTSKYEAVVVSA